MLKFGHSEETEILEIKHEMWNGWSSETDIFPQVYFVYVLWGKEIGKSVDRHDDVLEWQLL